MLPTLISIVPTSGSTTYIALDDDGTVLRGELGESASGPYITWTKVRSVFPHEPAVVGTLPR